jgi:hypothetical protein
MPDTMNGMTSAGAWGDSVDGLMQRQGTPIACLDLFVLYSVQYNFAFLSGSWVLTPGYGLVMRWWGSDDDDEVERIVDRWIWTGPLI